MIADSSSLEALMNTAIPMASRKKATKAARNVEVDKGGSAFQ